LRGKRGAVVASIEEERRTIGPELVDASELSQWATTVEARHRFPELMRRLLAATEGVTDIAVRTGEGVSAPGWDGLAHSAGSSYLPSGRLCFEFGVGAKPREKAEKDYNKRREDPQEVEPAESVYVFATPRRWTTAFEWVAEKRAEGFFRDVRVLDADNIEGWLQQTPAVHQWFSEQLGRRPRDAETLEQWWERFRSRTEPALPAALFLAGRGEERKALERFLLARPGVLALRSAWREDALAFCAATIEQMGGEAKRPQPPLLVSSADVWYRVISQAGRMTLLPLFDGADITAAVENGHHVVLAMGWEMTVFGDCIDLPRPDRAAASEALEAAGLDSEQAYRLSAQARRSMPSLMRGLSRDPNFVRPAWSAPPDAAVLSPLVLLGAWTTSAEDTAAVSEIAGRSWEEIERILLHWRATEDPPFVRPSTQWHLASAEQAYLILRDALTAADLKHWQELATEVLSQVDPRLKISAEDRMFPDLTGDQGRHSTVLRRGLAQGAALLATAGEVHLSDGLTGPEHARSLIVGILSLANEGDSVELWASLSEELQLLAEASPEAFLEAVHTDLDREVPLLKDIFQDGDQSSALFGSSPHTGLLWALEVLCWSAEHLPEAARALARLEKIDPGGRLSNRPLASLESVLVGWIRHTGAPLKTKVEVLENTRAELPEIAWRLVMGLWPSQHSVTSPPAAPRFRDWMPESRTLMVAEWVEYIGELVRLAIEMAANDAGRWAELAGRLGPLPPAERERLLEALEEFATPDSLSDGNRLVLWEAVDREVARHGRFPDAQWSMAEEPLSRLRAIADRLEPREDVARFAYLFDWRPDIPGSEEEYRAHTERLQELRRKAVAETLESASLEGVRILAEKSKVPSQLGFTLGTLDPEKLGGELLAWLDSDSPALRDVAASWAAYKLGQDDGAAWLREALGRPEMASAEGRTALALAARANSEIWDTLAELDPGLLDRYWNAVPTWGIDPADVGRATDELLAHGRSWPAVDLLAATLQGAEAEQEAIGVELIEAVLDAALRADSNETASQSPGYEVGVLLDRLEGLGCPAEKLAGYEFAFFRLLDDYRRPRALFPAMRAEPSVFVDLVKRVYRGRNEPRRQLDPHDQELAKHAWWVLEGWHELPGLLDDGTIDASHLTEWVRSARLAFADSDRGDIGDEQVGRVLSASPEGSDGIWPAEPVRELIEMIGSTRIETGLHTGIVNTRGITSRGVYDGGTQERELAARYRDWSKRTAAKWPRTSRMLRLLAESYEQDAREHDARAELSADTQ
jgi:hypothetical protein